VGEPDDYWKPEKDLIRAMSPRIGGIVGYLDAVRLRAERNVQGVLDETASTVGVDVRQLFETISQSDELLMLLAMTMEAAQRTAAEQKVHALAHALSSAVRQRDDATIDEAQMLISTIRELEAPHIRALFLVERYASSFDPADDRSLRRAASGRLDMEAVLADDFGGLAAPILAALVRHGLVHVNEPTARSTTAIMLSHSVTTYGRRVLDLVRRPTAV
jgi:hypothetical protein